mgnify:CR=1 FL=1
MSETMIALGDYRFSINTATYEELKRSQSFRWQAQERVQRRPALQYVGLGEESIELSGVIYPHYRGGLGQLNQLREDAGQGTPQRLIDGLGFVWGQFVIVSVSETQSTFVSNGQPLKQTFQLKLVNYGEDL